MSQPISVQDSSFWILLTFESYIDSCNPVLILINQESLIPFLYFVCHFLYAKLIYFLNTILCL